MEIIIFTHEKGMSIDECAFDDDCLITSVDGSIAIGLAEEFDLEGDGDYALLDVTDIISLEDLGLDVFDIDGDVYIYLNA